jgi:hypothetical protein
MLKAEYINYVESLVICRIKSIADVQNHLRIDINYVMKRHNIVTLQFLTASL